MPSVVGKDIENGDDTCRSELSDDPIKLGPTKEDLEVIKKELAQSLEEEAQLIERQRSLYIEQKKLRIEIEDRELEVKLAMLTTQQQTVRLSTQENLES